MTTQDQRAAFEAQIELPPLPRVTGLMHDLSYPEWVNGLLKDYARQAIEHGREQRGEPVAWLRNLTDPQPHAVTDLKYRPSNVPESAYVPVYSAPQPAEPDHPERHLDMVKPVKVPNDEDVMDTLDVAYSTGYEDGKNAANVVMDAQLAKYTEAGTQPTDDTIYLGCARMGLAGASDEEVIGYVHIAKQQAASPPAQPDNCDAVNIAVFGE